MKFNPCPRCRWFMRFHALCFQASDLKDELQSAIFYRNRCQHAPTERDTIGAAVTLNEARKLVERSMARKRR